MTTTDLIIAWAIFSGLALIGLTLFLISKGLLPRPSLKGLNRNIRRYNLVRILCDGMFNKQHNRYHRMGFGLIVMTIGILVAKGFSSIHEYGIHYFADGIGYLLHGIGATPFIEHLTSAEEEEI